MKDQMIHIHYAAETVPFNLPNGVVFFARGNIWNETQINLFVNINIKTVLKRADLRYRINQFTIRTTKIYFY
jgi:hypothetical protein